MDMLAFTRKEINENNAFGENLAQTSQLPIFSVVNVAKNFLTYETA